MKKFEREVTTGRAAKMLNCSQDTVTRMCEEGKLRARRDPRSGYWKIAFDSIMEYKTKQLTLA